jgi:methylated-DNA-[protein]-cysteine S-methyltransferase
MVSRRFMELKWMMTQLFIDNIEFELGQILLVSDGAALCAVDFSGYESRMMKLLLKRYKTVELVEQANPQGFSDRLQAYLAGDFSSLETIPVCTGGTPFQQQVWQSLRSIPPGTTLTYAQLADRVGKPNAYRAVGMANSQNPISIVLPCHRVIGSNTRLTGYAGGLDRKRWLLNHEGAIGRGVECKVNGRAILSFEF